MASVIIPTTPYPDTTLRVQLGGLPYTLRLLWSERCSAWHANIAAGDGTPILYGVRLVIGMPLLYRFRYLAVPPGELWFLDSRDMGGPPTLEDMGARFKLYYVDETGIFF